MTKTKQQKKKIAALADLHVTIADEGKWADLFAEISTQADVLLICGDLTDSGDEDEAKVLVKELEHCEIPIVAVLGNHDYEKGRHKLIRQLILDSKIHLLDGESVVIEGIGFAGVKGFGGGFDRHMLSMFGEAAMKAFVQAAVDESLALDRALDKLDQNHPEVAKIVLLHYSPIEATVIGESEKIFPFLGSSRLSEPLNRRSVHTAFHGHAHVGTFEGKTSAGIPVYNVALPLLRTHLKHPYFLLEIPAYHAEAI